MKKLRLLVMGLLLILPFMVGISVSHAESKKVNVYLFRGEGCPHCEEAIEWFNDTLSKDEEYSKYYELVKYEVWYDENNSNLMQEVATELGTEASGVPFIVIGDQYFSGFSATQSPDKIKAAIKEQYENKDYQDVVAAVKKGESIEKKGSKDSTSILPIVIVSAISVVVVLALVFFTKEK